MNVTGIIAEYNPFHNGHLYQLKLAKEKTNADFLVVAMSGDFMQRGIPGILNKWERAQMALLCGADLVLELPVLFSAASAEIFAAGGVSLLDRTGVVTGLCFGAETNDVDAFFALAGFLTKEPEIYKKELKAQLRTGKNFPSARNTALLTCMADSSPDGSSFSDLQRDDNFSGLLSSPNNILGLEYIKCLLRRNSAIKPYIVTRRGNGYNDTDLSGTFSSATAIRTALSRLGNPVQNSDTMACSTLPGIPASIKSAVPDLTCPVLEDAARSNRLLFTDDFSSILHYKLLSEKEKGFSSYLDVTEDFSNKIVNSLPSFCSYTDFATHLKTKELTHTRVNRALLHILLNLTDEKLELAKSLDFVPYLRVLGFRKSASPLLSAIKKNADIPLIPKLADAKQLLSKESYEILKQDIFASDVYRLALSVKTHRASKNEFQQSPILY